MLDLIIETIPYETEVNDWDELTSLEDDVTVVAYIHEEMGLQVDLMDFGFTLWEGATLLADVYVVDGAVERISK